MMTFVLFQQTNMLFLLIPESLRLKIWHLAGRSLGLKVWDHTRKVSVPVSKFETQIQSLSLKILYHYPKSQSH